MKRVVLKIGTKLLTTKHGKLDLNNLRQLCFQVTALCDKGDYEFILVTSGSIICGSESLNINVQTIPEKQAAAALGQILLMKEYYQFFEQRNHKAAQILLTKDGLNNKEKQLNIINTIQTLLKQNVIPIINENDTVATDEIQFGDNDMLSCYVAELVKADYFIILTDQDGIYTENPTVSKTAKLIPTLTDISDSMIDKAPSTVDTKGKGGIKSKLMAAQFALSKNIPMHIANGFDTTIISDILNKQKVGTCIKAKH